MCMQRRWPPPSYETETEVGLPHERLFTIACTILNYREVGKGKSKKVAKRLAAHKMWTRLQETPIDAAKINDSICSELEGDVSKLSLVDAVQQPAKTNNSPTPSRYYERVSPELNTIDIWVLFFYSFFLFLQNSHWLRLCNFSTITQLFFYYTVTYRFLFIFFLHSSLVLKQINI